VSKRRISQKSVDCQRLPDISLNETYAVAELATASDGLVPSELLLESSMVFAPRLLAVNDRGDPNLRSSFLFGAEARC
jgi:hypothetical protein